MKGRHQHILFFFFFLFFVCDCIDRIKSGQKSVYAQSQFSHTIFSSIAQILDLLCKSLLGIAQNFDSTTSALFLAIELCTHHNIRHLSLSLSQSITIKYRVLNYKCLFECFEMLILFLTKNSSWFFDCFFPNSHFFVQLFHIFNFFSRMRRVSHLFAKTTLCRLPYYYRRFR